MKMMKALLLTLASAVLFLASVHGQEPVCSESLATSTTQCIIANCPDFEEECDPDVNLFTCDQVQDVCNDWVDCCGACGSEITALLASCTPEEEGVTCGITSCRGVAAPTVSPAPTLMPADSSMPTVMIDTTMPTVMVDTAMPTELEPTPTGGAPTAFPTAELTSDGNAITGLFTLSVSLWALMWIAFI